MQRLALAQPATRTASLLRVSVAVTAESEDAVAEALGELLGHPAVIHQNAETGATTASVYLPNPSEHDFRELPASSVTVTQLPV